MLLLCYLSVGVPESDQYHISEADAVNGLFVNSMSTRLELCPYAAHGHCPYGDQCVYIHADVCDICYCAVLSPFDHEQRQLHIDVSKNTTTVLYGFFGGSDSS